MAMSEPRTVEYRDYDDVPTSRRHEEVSRFLWVATGCAFLFQLLGPLVTTPFVIYLAWLLFTGDVYYDEKDSEGRLKRWSVANRVAVVFLLLLHVWLFWVFARDRG
jgi:hypothetical protein